MCERNHSTVTKAGVLFAELCVHQVLCSPCKVVGFLVADEADAAKAEVGFLNGPVIGLFHKLLVGNMLAFVLRKASATVCQGLRSSRCERELRGQGPSGNAAGRCHQSPQHDSRCSKSQGDLDNE